MVHQSDPLDPAERMWLRDLVANDTYARVRAVAIGALARAVTGSGGTEVEADAWHRAARDLDASVRRRAAETAPAFGPAVPVG